MEQIRLALGKQAPVDVDCIRIEEQPGGSYKLTGTALCSDDDIGSVTLVDRMLFDIPDQVEEAGLAWADDIEVDRLFISLGTLSYRAVDRRRR